MKRVQPVIIAGGSGTRLWPLSRELYPKQFLSLAGAPSCFQQTLLRLRGVGSDPGFDDPIVVANEVHRFLIQEQAAQSGTQLQRIVLEPAGRNTAPALTVAALIVSESDPVLIMLPADHHIGDAAIFRQCLKSAAIAASQGRIASVGVPPTRPETGYGYIHLAASQAGQSPDDDTLPPVRAVDRFVEKPDLDAAQGYVRSGEFLWNSGIFVIRSSVWLDAIQRLRPDIYRACGSAVASGSEDGIFFRVDADAFNACPADSIDFAVMESVASDPGFSCVVVPFAGGWSDLGSWQAIWEAGEKDHLDNVCSGDVRAHDTRGSILMSQGRLVAAVGCENLVIAETADAVLVADRAASQSLRELVKALKEGQRPEILAHKLVHRPWGSYEVIASGDHYQVKRLTIKPGKKISLQLHQRRAEHWVVVKGTATVTKGETIITLRENESTYISSGTRHRLANDGSEPLEVVEVQTGEYLGEDDIVRFEDDFGRVKSQRD